jgi:hypothetical protein
MKTEIAIIRDRKIYRIEAPRGTRVFNGDRAQAADFDIVVADGVHYLASHVLEMARTGEKGFRLIGFEPLPEDR